MNLTTLTELKDFIFTRLREDAEDPTFWTEPEINSFINLGYKSMFEGSDAYIKIANIALENANSLYNLPLDFIKEIIVGCAGIDITENKKEITDIDTANLGTPDGWAYFGANQIILNPVNNVSGNLVFTYRAYPPPLTKASDKPIILYTALIEGIIFYTLHQCFDKEGDGQNLKASNLNLEKYLRAKATFTLFIENRRPTPGTR